MDINFIFTIAILVFSVVIHEVAHGYAALFQGDVTAKYAGRLTLNPIKHIDPVGSILVPAILAILPGGLIFGWAKPVPYNPYNLRNQRWGELIVAIAGPISNIIIAIIFGLLIRFSEDLGLSSSFVDIGLYVVLINIVLAVFNLIPIPPSDGSKILFSLFPNQTNLRRFLEGNNLIFLFILLFFVWSFFLQIIYFITEILTGI